jgi:hypothetical protein
MTDLLQNEGRLRKILSNWYQSRRPRRGKAMPVRSSRYTELNRELEDAPISRWFFAGLFVIAMLNYFYLQYWG